MALPTIYNEASVWFISWSVCPLKEAVFLISYNHKYGMPEGFRVSLYSQATHGEISIIVNPGM